MSAQLIDTRYGILNGLALLLWILKLDQNVSFKQKCEYLTPLDTLKYRKNQFMSFITWF